MASRVDWVLLVSGDWWDWGLGLDQKQTKLHCSYHHPTSDRCKYSVWSVSSGRPNLATSTLSNTPQILCSCTTLATPWRTEHCNFKVLFYHEIPSVVVARRERPEIPLTPYFRARSVYQWKWYSTPCPVLGSRKTRFRCRELDRSPWWVWWLADRARHLRIASPRTPSSFPSVHH